MYLTIVKFVTMVFFRLLFVGIILFPLGCFVQSQTYFSGNGVMDVEGNMNETIVLGNGQEWMATNLSVNRFSDGTELTYCENQQVWATSETPCYTAYSNNLSNVNQLGYLYNFYSVESDRNICPSGWRVPTELDWSKFSNYIGGLAVAGGKLKSTSSQHWSAPNIGATNEINFSAIAGGCRYNQGYFNNLNTYAFFWTSSELDGTWAWYRSLKNDSDEMIRNFSKKQSGYSIRCMRDLDAGMNDENFQQISIYPNPVVDEFEIFMNDELKDQIEQIIITDLSGNHIFYRKGNKTFFDFIGLPQGVYLVEVNAKKFNVKKRIFKI